MKLRLLLLALLCAGVPAQGAARNYNPDKLAKTKIPQAFMVREPVQIRTRSYFHDVVYTIQPGQYVRTYEGKDGYFLVGPPGCLHEQLGASSTRLNCGILVPRDEAKGAQILVILGDVAKLDANDAQRIAAASVPSASAGAQAAGGAIGGILVNLLMPRAGDFSEPRKTGPVMELRSALLAIGPDAAGAEVQPAPSDGPAETPAPALPAQPGVPAAPPAPGSRWRQWGSGTGG